jgi:hypothetical protein
MPTHAGDGAADAAWPRLDVDDESCQRQCYRVMLAMALPGYLAVARCRCRVMQVTMLSSQAGDDAMGSTWPWRDVDDK